MTQAGGGRIVIVVQHLPVPLDRRIWSEARSLARHGHRVSVVCTMAPGDPAYEERDGVHLYKFAPAPMTAGALSFVFEFVYCWVRVATRVLRLYRREGIDVLQACNPPDTYFALAAPLKLLGVRFVWDQRDLCPEMYQARFKRDRGPLLWGLRLLERLSYRVADEVVVPNDSYRAVALSRGGKAPAAVTVVRGAPETDELRPIGADPRLRRGRAHLCCFLGVMGPQDHVDVALRAVRHYVHDLGRDDCHFAFLGFGDSLADLRLLATELGLDDVVTFTGMAQVDSVRAYLSTAALGVVPDQRTPYSDQSTLTKVMEYMAFGLPVVAFDLRESRVSAQDAAVFVASGDVAGFAEAMAELLDDPDRRERMGRAGRARVAAELSWPHQEPAYVAVHERLLALASR